MLKIKFELILYVHVNISAIISSSDQFEIQNGVVSWDPAMAFPTVPTQCISGYQYSINGANVTVVTMTSFTLDSYFSHTQRCGCNTLTIEPIVILGNLVLRNIEAIGTSCEKGILNDL